MLEQFGGPQEELAAACRYFTQALAEDDPGRKDMLFDIATEELSHLEVIGNIVVMLNKGAKGRLAEGVEQEGEIYRSITGASNDSDLTQLLYGGGAPLTNSGHSRNARQWERPTGDQQFNSRIYADDGIGYRTELIFCARRFSARFRASAGRKS